MCSSYIVVIVGTEIVVKVGIVVIVVIVGTRYRSYSK